LEPEKEKERESGERERRAKTGKESAQLAPEEEELYKVSLLGTSIAVSVLYHLSNVLLQLLLQNRLFSLKNVFVNSQ
jgi:hypothetical protein